MNLVSTLCSRVFSKVAVKPKAAEEAFKPLSKLKTKAYQIEAEWRLTHQTKLNKDRFETIKSKLDKQREFDKQKELAKQKYLDEQRELEKQRELAKQKYLDELRARAKQNALNEHESTLKLYKKRISNKDWSGLNLDNVSFEYSKLNNIQFVDSSMKKTNLIRANATDCDFSRTNIESIIPEHSLKQDRDRLCFIGDTSIYDGATLSGKWAASKLPLEVKAAEKNIKLEKTEQGEEIDFENCFWAEANGRFESYTKKRTEIMDHLGISLEQTNTLGRKLAKMSKRDFKFAEEKEKLKIFNDLKQEISENTERIQKLFDRMSAADASFKDALAKRQQEKIAGKQPVTSAPQAGTSAPSIKQNAPEVQSGLSKEKVSSLHSSTSVSSLHSPARSRKSVSSPHASTEDTSHSSRQASLGSSTRSNSLQAEETPLTSLENSMISSSTQQSGKAGTTPKANEQSFKKERLPTLLGKIKSAFREQPDHTSNKLRKKHSADIQAQNQIVKKVSVSKLQREGSKTRSDQAPVNTSPMKEWKNWEEFMQTWTEDLYTSTSL